MAEVISQASPVPTKSAGTADIVGFGIDGVVILRNSISLNAAKTIEIFGYTLGGWHPDKHVCLIADTTGDKQADLVGFGETGVWISFNQGKNTFTRPPKMVLSGYAYSSGGWRIDKHIRFMADIRNIGRADIVGFGDTGVSVSLNHGSGNFAAPQVALPSFGYDQGWKLDRHLRFLADVTGDGLLDIVGFGENRVYIALNKGNGTFRPPEEVLNAFCIAAGGWSIDRHPRFVVDLTGDGRADILGCSNAGVMVSLNTGAGAFAPPKFVLGCFGPSQGWSVAKHPRFVASLTGEKYADIIGFGDSGVYVALNYGDGTFQPATRVIDNFGYDQGWRVEKHPRFVADLTGNGCADIIGFGEDAVWVSFNQGGGKFGPATKLTDEFSFGKGWSLDKTVRYVANLYR